MRIREAAMLPALFAALIQFLLPFFVDDAQTTAVLNGAVAFVAGLVTAFLVSAEKGLAFLVGGANTIIQLAAGFGLTMTDSQQALLATILTMVAAAFTRTQVVAPVARAAVQSVQEPAPVIRRQTGGSLG